MIDTVKKATILSQALPYIQKYHGKIIVVKYGGNAMTSSGQMHGVIDDIALLSTIGIKVLMVHGGGPEISHMLERVQKESVFVDGLRCTDEETMEIVQMVLAGKVNKDLVSMLYRAGARSIGISGMDCGMIKVKKRASCEDLGYVGEIVDMDERPILDLLEKGYIPVIAGLGVDEDNHSYNINADTAASFIAGRLRAENMVLISNIPGLLQDPRDESSIIPKISVEEAGQLKEDGVISKGMIPKIDCLVNAVESGVRHACIIDGRIPHSLLIEILSDEGIGTMV